MIQGNEEDFKVYTAQEVADILKVHEMSVKRYIRKGLLKKINTGEGSAIRVTHRELIKFITGKKEG